MKTGKKKILLSLVASLFLIEGYCQVGINTKTPLFDLDVRGDMLVVGSVRIGGNPALSMNRSIQLELGDNDKGLLLNRVALTNLLVKAPVLNAVDGTLVFNTVDDERNQLYSGVHVWRSGSWKRLVDQIPPKRISLYYAAADVVAGPASGSDQSSMVNMPFADERGVGIAGADALLLPETGSYAINVKLYTTVCDATGNSVRPKNAGKVVVYVGVWVNNVLNDVSEIFYTIAPVATGTTNLNGSNLTNVILGCSGFAGNKVDIRIGYLAGSISSGEYIKSVYSTSKAPNSAATSMLYWKL